MFRTVSLSIIRSLNNVHTAIGTCHTGFADCLQVGSEKLSETYSKSKFEILVRLFGLL